MMEPKQELSQPLPQLNMWIFKENFLGMKFGIS